MRAFCSVCSSSQQTLIDRRLQAGESLATLSADYGLPVRELRHAMSRTCTVCTHPERAAIDQALAAGRPYRDIAGQFAVSRSALDRHAGEHLPPALIKAQEAAGAEQAIDIVKQLKAINGVSLSILDEARRSGNAETALRAVDRIHRQIELQAKLLGELDERPHVDIVLTPEWLSARAALLAALAPYPEARVAVAQRLLSLEAAQGAPNGHRG